MFLSFKLKDFYTTVQTKTINYQKTLKNTWKNFHTTTRLAQAPIESTLKETPFAFITLEKKQRAELAMLLFKFMVLERMEQRCSMEALCTDRRA